MRIATKKDKYANTSWRTKFVIPQPTTIDEFTSISNAQIKNLQFALNGISGQMAAMAAQQKNWSIFEDFENVTEQAFEFTKILSEELEEEHCSD